MKAVSKKDAELILIARKYGLSPGSFKAEVFWLFERGFTGREVKFIYRDMKVEANDQTFSGTINRYRYSWKHAQKTAKLGTRQK
jgi:hypothetical protein